VTTPEPEAYSVYTDWYVWAKRNLSMESTVCHAAAATATEVMESGGTREQAIEAARRSFSTGAHAVSGAADVRRRTYAEWFDWARRERLDRLVLHASPEGRPLYDRLGFVATNEMRFADELEPSPAGC